MPGVPSSRGCEACRAQKKKCELLADSCLRCKRLRIACIGGGLQRYKFQPERFVVRTSRSITPSPPLGNDLSRLTTTFVDAISVQRSVNIQLTCNFGPFLEDIPCRLGSSEALDAAADTLVLAYARFCAGHVRPNDRFLTKHAATLSVLRTSLDDPVKARSPETLCAIELILMYGMFQPFGCGYVTGHSAGAVQVLRARGCCGARNDFERKLLNSLALSMLVESLLDERITLTLQEWHQILYTGDGHNYIDGDMIRCLPRVHRLVQSAREATDGTRLLGNFYGQARDLRWDFSLALDRLRQRFYELEARTDGKEAPIFRLHCLRSYGFALAISIVIDRVLSGIVEQVGVALDDPREVVDEMVRLARLGLAYRPIGSSTFLLGLAVAWVVCADSAMRESVEALGLNYQRDFYGPDATLDRAELQHLEQRLDFSYLSS